MFSVEAGQLITVAVEVLVFEVLVQMVVVVVVVVLWNRGPVEEEEDLPCLASEVVAVVEEEASALTAKYSNINLIYRLFEWLQLLNYMFII